MDIRKGMFLHSGLMFRADGLMAELDELYKTSTVQNSVDMDKIDDLYLKVIGERFSGRLLWLRMKYAMKKLIGRNKVKK
jgi:thiamine monophosphate kinase